MPQSRAGSLPPERVESIHFTHFSNFRDYLASATCLKSKISQSLSVQSALAAQTLSRGPRVFLGTECSGEQLLTGSVPEKLGVEGGGEGERKPGEREGKRNTDGVPSSV